LTFDTSTAEVAVNKRFLDTSIAASAQDWDDLLRLQVDVLSEIEFDYLEEFEPWHRAESVLDAGCGNGYYLSRLRAAFPGRKYVGLDISDELIDRARAMDIPDASLVRAGFFGFEPSDRFDIVVMRLFVQHLADIRPLLAQGERVLAPGGGLLIIESDPRQSPIPSELPKLAAMLRRFEMITATGGGVRLRLLRDLDALVWEASAGRWRVSSDAVVFGRTTLAESKLMRIFRLWTDLCERQKIFPCNFEGVRRELEAASKVPRLVCEVAMRMIYLQPTATSAA